MYHRRPDLGSPRGLTSWQAGCSCLRSSKGGLAMRTQLPLHLPVALLLTIPAAACTTDSSPADDDVDAVASSLELENGGFDTADEAPQFGEETLFAAADIEADAAVTDPFAVDPTVAQLE